MTGVKSRWVVVTCGIFLLLLGLIPKVSEAIANIPGPVIGGAPTALGYGAVSGVTDEDLAAHSGHRVTAATADENATSTSAGNRARASPAAIIMTACHGS